MTDKKLPPLTHCGIQLEDGCAVFKIPTLNLAMLVRSLNDLDSEQIKSDIFRAHFELWRETLQVTARGCMALEYVGDKQASQLEEDIMIYLLGKPGPVTGERDASRGHG